MSDTSDPHSTAFAGEDLSSPDPDSIRREKGRPAHTARSSSASGRSSSGKGSLTSFSMDTQTLRIVFVSELSRTLSASVQQITKGRGAPDDAALHSFISQAESMISLAKAILVSQTKGSANVNVSIRMDA